MKGVCNVIQISFTHDFDALFYFSFCKVMHVIGHKGRCTIILLYPYNFLVKHSLARRNRE